MAQGPKQTQGGVVPLHEMFPATSVEDWERMLGTTPRTEAQPTLGAIESGSSSVSPYNIMYSMGKGVFHAGRNLYDMSQRILEQPMEEAGVPRAQETVHDSAVWDLGGVMAMSAAGGLRAGGAIAAANAPRAAPWFSAVSKAVEASQLKAAPAEQWLGTIKNTPGIKQEELDWIGLEDWLVKDNNPDRVLNKDMMNHFIKNNQVDVQEVLHGKPEPVHPSEKPKRATKPRVLGPTIKDIFTGRQRAAPRHPAEASPVEIAKVREQANLYHSLSGNTDLDANLGVRFRREIADALGAEDRELAYRRKPEFPNVEPLIQRIREGDEAAAAEVAVLLRERAREKAEYAVRDKAYAGRKRPVVLKTKYDRYTMDGGENYRELLLTMPPKAHDPYLGLRDPVAGAKQDAQLYRSGHWDEPNILAHVRFKDRVDVDGKKSLGIEEIQSDWHQQGREKGYAQPGKPVDTTGWTADQGGGTSNPWFSVKDANGNHVYVPHRTGGGHYASKEEIIRAAAEYRSKNPEGVPDAPFKTSWPELALKRMIRWAAEHGYDQITWTPGKVQADRYKLSSHIDSITWGPPRVDRVGGRTVDLAAHEGSLHSMRMDVDGDGRVVSTSNARADQFVGHTLDEIIGKDHAARIMSEERGRVTGADLDVGGQGMKTFYDKMLPNKLNKMFNKKEFGFAKVGTTNAYIGDSYRVGQNKNNGMWEVRRDDGHPEFEFAEEREAIDRAKLLNERVKKQEVWSLPITDAMRTKVLSEGMALFANAPKSAATMAAINNLTVGDAFPLAPAEMRARQIVQATKAQGGFSINPNTGEIPTEGLMMGKYANTDPRTRVVEGELTEADVIAHAKKNKTALEKPENFLGTWKDPDSGKTFLDVSQRFAPNQIRQAVKYGERTGQLAGFDLGKMDSFTVGNWKKFIESPEFHARVDQVAAEGRQYLQKQTTKEWWDMHGTAFERVYGKKNLKQVAGFMASTAPNRKPRDNTQTMSEYMRRFIKKEPILQPDWRVPETAMSRTPGVKIGMEESSKINLTKSAKGDLKALRREKVSEEAQAMMGDPNAVVLDRHWVRISEKPSENIYAGTQEGAMPHGSPSFSPYADLKAQVVAAAKRAGRDPRDFSADAWTGIRERIKNTGELFGEKYKASAVGGESKSYADHFEDLIREKAKHLGITVPEMELRLSMGDAELLSYVLAAPIGALMLEELLMPDAEGGKGS